MVLRAMSTPRWSKCCSSRYSGRCSLHLADDDVASSPGPGKPFSIGWAGLVAISICGLPSQCSHPSPHGLQAYL